MHADCQIHVLDLSHLMVILNLTVNMTLGLKFICLNFNSVSIPDNLAFYIYWLFTDLTLHPRVKAVECCHLNLKKKTCVRNPAKSWCCHPAFSWFTRINMVHVQCIVPLLHDFIFALICGSLSCFKIQLSMIHTAYTIRNLCDIKQSVLKLMNLPHIKESHQALISGVLKLPAGLFFIFLVCFIRVTGMANKMVVYLHLNSYLKKIKWLTHPNWPGIDAWWSRYVSLGGVLLVCLWWLGGAVIWL